ncbi:unnamed protein product [Owenia fusiformis]|uniref:Uncharacterized protein n=1 Tax=Owenia fusiformis TaxID=6347 RepID=A0A8J1T5H0_OWEFU|nr:unnamed protein product [Owenia fusiformis]
MMRIAGLTPMRTYTRTYVFVVLLITTCYLMSMKTQQQSKETKPLHTSDSHVVQMKDKVQPHSRDIQRLNNQRGHSRITIMENKNIKVKELNNEAGEHDSDAKLKDTDIKETNNRVSDSPAPSKPEKDEAEESKNPPGGLDTDKQQIDDTTEISNAATSNADQIKPEVVPDAMIAGIKKCGTGTVTSFLSNHPNLTLTHHEEYFISPKQIPVWYEDWRIANFSTFTPHDHVLINRCTMCFQSLRAVEKAWTLNPKLKLIFMTRDPTERIMSDYTQYNTRAIKKQNSTLPPVEESDRILDKDGEVDENSGLITTSSYIKHIKKWLQVFPIEQMYFADHNLFTSQPWTELQNLEKFLKLPAYFEKSQFVPSESKSFYCFKNWCPAKGKGRDHVETSQDVLIKLRTYFKPLNEALFQLLGKKMDWA